MMLDARHDLCLNFTRDGVTVRPLVMDAIGIRWQFADRNNSSSKRRPAAISVPKAEAAAQIGSVSPILRLGNLSNVANGTLVLPLMSREFL
jgi:hypothetical protein